MADTFNIKGIERILQKDLLRPSIYELSLMTKKQRSNRIKEYLKKTKELGL